METTVLERIKQLEKALGITDNALAKKLGIPQATVSGWYNLGRTPSIKLPITLLEVYPNLSAEWLLRGEGSMFKETKEQSAESNEGNTLVGNNNSAINQTIAPKKGLPARLIAAILRACPNQEEQDKIIKEIDDFNNQ